MTIPQTVRRLLHLPSRIALILGLGALSTTGAQADAPAAGRDAAAAPEARGELMIRTAGGKIYLSEAGRGFREVPLGDTAEARRLRQLLEDSGAAAGPDGLRLTPMLLAGGGGAGFHWAPFGKADDPPPEKNAAPDRSAPPDRAGTGQKPAPPTLPKAAGGNPRG